MRYFKIGDKVRVLELSEEERLEPLYVDDMYKRFGKVGKITETPPSGRVSLDIGYWWEPSWVVLINSWDKIVV